MRAVALYWPSILASRRRVGADTVAPAARLRRGAAEGVSLLSVDQANDQLLEQVT